MAKTLRAQILAQEDQNACLRLFGYFHAKSSFGHIMTCLAVLIEISIQKSKMVYNNRGRGSLKILFCVYYLKKQLIYRFNSGAIPLLYDEIAHLVSNGFTVN